MDEAAALAGSRPSAAESSAEEKRRFSAKARKPQAAWDWRMAGAALEDAVGRRRDGGVVGEGCRGRWARARARRGRGLRGADRVRERGRVRMGDGRWRAVGGLLRVAEDTVGALAAMRWVMRRA